MSYKLKLTNQFKKDVKLCQKRGLPMDELWEVMRILIDTGKLPLKYKAHLLSGNRANQWECHIKPDWLLIWEQNDEELLLLMLNTGRHTDLFGKTRR